MTDAAGSPLDLNIRDVGAGFRSGAWSPTELTRTTLERITETEPVIRAWTLVDPERALADAERATAELAAGVDRGPLHGIPIGVKDIFDAAGWPTRCGSAALRDAQPANRDAATVAALREAGAVLLGKTVTQEFAAGVVSAPARNPWDPSRIPGGSSGGSAAALAARTCLGALGSDTGGSIRIPAAACGVVGFKPTYGDLSVGGVYPLSWSLDTVGPLARTVTDTEILWLAMARRRLPDWTAKGPDSDLTGVRVGVPRQHFFASIQEDVGAAIDVALEQLRELSATVIETEWSLAAAARAAAFIVNRIESAFVHERVATHERERFLLYGNDLRLRVAAGSTLPASLYLQAQLARRTVRESMAGLFAKHRLHALAVPTLPTAAVSADDLAITGTGLDESLGGGWTRLTMPFNATGQPVLAMPCGFDRAGLPVGLQLAGESGRESILFEIGRALEASLGQVQTAPPLLAQSKTHYGV